LFLTLALLSRISLRFELFRRIYYKRLSFAAKLTSVGSLMIKTSLR
jgi:hypothetical protein